MINASQGKLFWHKCINREQLRRVNRDWHGSLPGVCLFRHWHDIIPNSGRSSCSGHGNRWDHQRMKRWQAGWKNEGIVNMYACIAHPVVEAEYFPRASEQIHRHLGFSTVGEFHQCACKFGRSYNMIWWQISPLLSNYMTIVPNTCRMTSAYYSRIWSWFP